MYVKIESQFKKRSACRKTQLFFIFAVLAWAILSTFASNVICGKVLFWHSIISVDLFYIGVYGYVIISVRNENDFKLKKAWNVFFIVDLYQIKIHDHDHKLLKEILNENHVNTRAKTLEAIRHYQVLIPRRIVSSGNLISIVALTTSIIALLLDDDGFKPIENTERVFTIIFTVVLFYLMGSMINKTIFKVFGEEELYKRLEASLSKIYMMDEEISYVTAKEIKNGR